MKRSESVPGWRGQFSAHRKTYTLIANRLTAQRSNREIRPGIQCRKRQAHQQRANKPHERLRDGRRRGSPFPHADQAGQQSDGGQQRGGVDAGIAQRDWQRRRQQEKDKERSQPPMRTKERPPDCGGDYGRRREGQLEPWSRRERNRGAPESQRRRDGEIRRGRFPAGTAAAFIAGDKRVRLSPPPRGYIRTPPPDTRPTR